MTTVETIIRLNETGTLQHSLRADKYGDTRTAWETWRNRGEEVHIPPGVTVVADYIATGSVSFHEVSSGATVVYLTSRAEWDYALGVTR
jgi:hypothetical protein